MNGTQITETSFFNDIPHTDLTPTETLRRPATAFMYPEEVASDLWLTHAEKREILVSWASDARAVPDAPALRQLDNGAVVRIDDVLRMLNSLDEGAASEQTAFNPFPSYTGLHICLLRPMRPSLRRDWPDDDDPPPCPAMAAKPPSGPLCGEGAAALDLSLAA
jgi:hypothetical protein